MSDVPTPICFLWRRMEEHEAMVSYLVAVLLKQPLTLPLLATHSNWICSLPWLMNSCAGKEAKVGMSGSTRTAQPGTGAAEIAAEPQSPLPNLPPLLT